MRTSTRVLVATAISWSLAAVAQADPAIGYTLEDFKLRSGQDLVDICSLAPTHPDAEVARGFCYGYIEGGKHYHDAVAAAPDRGPIVCPGDSVTAEEAVAVVVAYAKAHPEYAAGPPMELVFRAGAEKWPCGQAGGQTR